MDIDFSKVTPCGEYCDGCGYLKSGECRGCRETEGKCVKMWQNGCQIYKCCIEHNVQFCGLCNEFPCEWLECKIGEWNDNGIYNLEQLRDRYKESKMKVIIDRFEGDFAVCEKEKGKMINIEKSKIPLSAKEGDVLIIEGDQIRIDAAGTAERRDEVRKLMKDLWE